MAQLIEEGFNFGFQVPPFEGIGCEWVENLKSVNLHPEVAFDKLWKEIKKGRVAGPFSEPPFVNFRFSPLGVVPKKEPNTFRLIHHLSFLFGTSFNDCIDKELSAVSYSTFDQAIFLVRQFGP